MVPLKIRILLADGHLVVRRGLRMVPDAEHLFEALRAGASGHVLKSAADHDLIEACRAAVRGETFLYPRAIKALVRELLASGEPRDPLSARELERATPVGRSAKS